MFRFPWGDFHSLNLGWFLQKFNELREDWATAEAGIDAEIQKAEDALTDVFAARDAAAASASAANSSALNASQSSLASMDARDQSRAARDAAQQAAGNAAASETAAGQSARNAAASETAAGNSAAAAAASETAAGQSATDAEETASSIEASAQQIATNASNIEILQNAVNELTQSGYINPIGIFTGKIFPNKSSHQAGQMTAQLNGNRITVKKVSSGSTAVNLYPSGSTPYFESVARTPKYMYENNRMAIFESLNVQELSILLLTEKTNNFPFWLIFSTYNPTSEEETSYTISPASLTEFGINYLEIPLPHVFIEKVNTNKNIGLRLNFGTSGNANIDVNNEQVIDFYIVPKAFSEASTLALTLSN